MNASDHVLAAYVRQSRAAQGLPSRVTDVCAIARVAALAVVSLQSDAVRADRPTFEDASEVDGDPAAGLGSGTLTKARRYNRGEGSPNATR